ncbi:MAG: peptidylprolyl isomerase [Armatimonadetes bacterium]|nr:peptidylprolyl isomerase [Armatimonadota bacterium]
MIHKPTFRTAVFAASLVLVAAPVRAQTKPSPATVAPKPAAPAKPAPLPAGVAARVNGKNITFDALAAQLKAWKGSPMIQEAVAELVIAQEAKKYKVTVTAAEIAAEVFDFKQKRVEQERTSGRGMATWREIAARYGIADSYLTDYVRGIIVARKTYAKFLESNIKGLDEQRKIAIIALTNLPATPPKPGDAPDTPEAIAKRDADAKTKIEGILADIKANKISFADAAKQFSADKDENGGGSAARGGELPWLPRTLPNGRPVGDPPFVDAMFGLAKVGDVTPAPVKVPNGYLLIKLLQIGTDATPAEKAAYKKSQVDAQLQNQQGFAQWRAYLVQTAKVDYAAAPMPVPPALLPSPQP